MKINVRALSVLGLTAILVACQKGKTPATDDTAAAAAAGSASVIDVLGAYDLNSIYQIQFETAATNSYRPSPKPTDVAKRILILTLDAKRVTGSGIYIQTVSGAKCTGSVAAFDTSDLSSSLAAATLGPNTNPALAPDRGYDRLSVFFKDGTSKLIPFDDAGAPANQRVIREAADEPLYALLRSVFDSGTCQPN